MCLAFDSLVRGHVLRPIGAPKVAVGRQIGRRHECGTFVGFVHVSTPNARPTLHDNNLDGEKNTKEMINQKKNRK